MDRFPLTIELNRIISCSYPASLAILAELLACANREQIRASILQFPPCSISKLGTIVYQALPHWSHAFEAFSRLCHSPEFRDTFLLQNPDFLDALLGKAISSQRDFDNYFETCILLLSRPLPAAMLLPASAQVFFMQAFESASQNPTVSNLRSVYRMLNGACQDLLSIMPNEQRQRLDEELRHILSSTNGTKQDFTLPLWCFGIVLCSEKAPKNASAGPDEVTEADRTYNSAAGRMLFGSTSKLCKTINLTYLSVIWATKGDVGISDEEAIEGIQIAIRTLDFIDKAILKAWPTSSSLAKNTFPKLLSKTLRAEINPTVKILASTVYAMVAPDDGLPYELLSRYEESMSSVVMGTASHDVARAAIISFPVYASQTREPAILSLIHQVLNACLAGSKVALSADIIELVEVITSSAATCPSLRENVVTASVSPNLHGMIVELVQLEQPTEFSSCCTYSAATRRQLIPAVFAMLLITSFASEDSERGMPLPLIASLIQRQRHTLLTSGGCNHMYAVPESKKLSLFQQENTPYTGQHLEDWRQRLKSELENQSIHQRDIITRSVAQICQDLESRCNTIEEPLRREKARCQELEDELHRLHEDVVSLESQAADGRFQLDGLEDEKQLILDEKDSLAAKLDDLQSLYHEANEGAAEVLRTTKEHFDARELELQSLLLTHEEDLRICNDTTKEQYDTIVQLRRDLEKLREEKNELREQHDQLKHVFSDTEEMLEGQRVENTAQHDESQRLQWERDLLENSLRSAQTQLEEASISLDKIRSQHDELLRTSEAERSDLDAKYADEICLITRRAEEQREDTNARLEEALEAGRRAKAKYEDSRHELGVLQNSIPSLEAKAEELSTICSEQDEELEELKTWRRNVLASMGLDGQASLALRPTTHNGKEKVSRDHRRRKSALQANQSNHTPTTNHGPRPAETHDDSTSPFHAQAASNSSQESTPKRAKPRTTFRVPSMTHSLAGQPVFTPKNPSKQMSLGRRSALKQMSPNRRQTTADLAALNHDDGKLSQEAQISRPRRGSYQDRKQAPDIDMDNFLRDTPLTPGNFITGTGRVPSNEDNEDGTMTEL